MRACAVVLLIILITSFAAPALAAGDDKYGYITVEKVQILLENETATIHVDYTVDESTRFIFFLFGKQDLKNKLMKILNYKDAQIKRIDLTSADFVVQEAAFNVGNGVYWYPDHDFNIVIPNLTVRSPQAVKHYSQTDRFRGGMGYFSDNEPVLPPQPAPDAGRPEPPAPNP